MMHTALAAFVLQVTDACVRQAWALTWPVPFRRGPGFSCRSSYSGARFSSLNLCFYSLAPKITSSRSPGRNGLYMFKSLVGFNV